MPILTSTLRLPAFPRNWAEFDMTTIRIESASKKNVSSIDLLLMSSAFA